MDTSGSTLDIAQQVLMQAFQNRRKRMDALQAPSPAPVGMEEHDHGPSAFSEDGDLDMLSATFNKSLQKFLAALGGKAKVTSQKREAKRQQELWAQALKKYGDPEIADNYVARPGGSYHEKGAHGLAADLSYADPRTREEAHRLAAQFGLWFPMAHEPWHVEPIATRRMRGKK